MKKKGEPHVWLEEGEEEISSFLSHTYNALKKRKRESAKRNRMRRKEKQKEMRKRKRKEEMKEKKGENEKRMRREMGKRKKSKKGKNKTKLRGKRGEEEREDARGFFSSFSRERVSSFSLGSWEIQPSDSFTTRRRVVLLGEDNA